MMRSLLRISALRRVWGINLRYRNCPLLDPSSSDHSATEVHSHPGRDRSRLLAYGVAPGRGSRETAIALQLTLQHQDAPRERCQRYADALEGHTDTGDGCDGAERGRGEAAELLVDEVVGAECRR